jgi:hypothetical protein
MKFSLLAFFIFIIQLKPRAQQTSQPQYISAIAGFYNLENLFDTINDTRIEDEEFLPNSEKKYNTAAYNRKLSYIAKVIAGMGTDVNPEGLALLGVVEIENGTVLKDLLATAELKDRNYQYVQYQSPDERGIDVGLIYNPKYFTVLESHPHTVLLPDKHPTRDILVVKGDFVGDTVYVLVNHWPSRRGGNNAADLANKDVAYNSNNTGLRTDGEELSRPARLAAAKECMSIVDSIYMQNPKAKIMIMGDLNDDPTSPSVVNGIKAKDDMAAVQPKDIYNPFTEYFKKGFGTLVFGGKWNLFDQIMFSQSWLDQQQLKGWFLYKSHIYYRDFLIEQKGDYKGYPKRSWVGNRWNDGYSDHLPVYTVLVRALLQ